MDDILDMDEIKESDENLNEVEELSIEEMEELSVGELEDIDDNENMKQGNALEGLSAYEELEELKNYREPLREEQLKELYSMRQQLLDLDDTGEDSEDEQKVLKLR